LNYNLLFAECYKTFPLDTHISQTQNQLPHSQFSRTWNTWLCDATSLSTIQKDSHY